ncbi:MAG: hypothetical protein JWO38_2720 [Gemmataceae bacterium]|nr:hypothetical protein [Gemmataceae bacterium]
MTTFYRVDGARLTFAEYWRMSPNPLVFLIAAWMKLIGRPIRFSFSVPRPDRLFLVEFDELPAAARAGMGPLVDAAEAIGLRLVFCHRLVVPEPHRLGAAAILLDKTGETILLVIFSRQGNRVERHLACTTLFTDGSRAVTTTIRKTFEPLPGSHVARYPGADPASLLARHREHLAALTSEGLIPTRLEPNRLPDVVHEAELRFVDFHIGRGVFVPMTDEELDKLCRPRE